MIDDFRKTLRDLWWAEGKTTFQDADRISYLLEQYLPEYSRRRILIGLLVRENIPAALSHVDENNVGEILSFHVNKISSKYDLSYNETVSAFSDLGYAMYGEKFESMSKHAFDLLESEHSNLSWENENVQTSSESDYANTSSDDLSKKPKALFLCLAAVAAVGIILIEKSFVSGIVSRFSDPKKPQYTVSETQQDIPVEPVSNFITDDLPTIHETSLLELHDIQTDGAIQKLKDVTINTGEKYGKALCSLYPYRSISYTLNKQYQIFTAKWALSSAGKNSSDENTIEIYADGVKIFCSSQLRQGATPSIIELDISGCDILTIMFCQTRGDAMLLDPMLRGVNQSAPYQVLTPALPCWLNEYKEFATNGSISFYSTSYPRYCNTGKMVAHALHGGSNCWADYYLDKQYERLSGVWALTDTGANTTSHYQLHIFADKAPVYVSEQLTQGSVPIEFDVSIGKCEILRIEITSDGGGYNGDYVVANLRLYPDHEDSPGF